MEPHRTNERSGRFGEIGFCVLLAGIAVALLLKAQSASAREAESEVAASVPCALLTEVAGEVDVLDSSRTHLLDSTRHAAVPCAGWVSVGKGSAELRHRDGFTIHLGAGSFAQFVEPNTDGHDRGEQVILFRGQVFVQAGGGSGELRVLTANARARISRGSAIVVYNHEDEETQLIALDTAASLENRFETTRKVTAKAGEATSLNFKQLRVVPSLPRAVALAALRPKFDDLRVPERDRRLATGSAQSRQERLFATQLVETDEDGSPKRAIASLAEKGPGAEVRERLQKEAEKRATAASYSSHIDDAQAERARRKWVNRMVAGVGGAEGFVSPGAQAPARNPAGSAGRIEVTDGEADARSARKAPRKLTPEDEEKLKLIDELSRIHDE